MHPVVETTARTPSAESSPVRVGGRDDDDEAMSAANSNRTRVLMVLAGGVVMQMSPGSHANVVNMCASGGWLESFHGFCSMTPGMRVALCVLAVSSLFLADYVLAGLAACKSAAYAVAVYSISCIRHTNRDTVAARARDVRVFLIAFCSALWSMLRYASRTGSYTLRALGFRVKPHGHQQQQGKSSSFFWPQSLVRRARDQWKVAFDNYSKTYKTRQQPSQQRKQGKKKAQHSQKKGKETDMLRETLSSPPVMNEEFEETTPSKETPELTPDVESNSRSTASTSSSSARGVDSLGWDDSEKDCDDGAVDESLSRDSPSVASSESVVGRNVVFPEVSSMPARADSVDDGVSSITRDDNPVDDECVSQQDQQQRGLRDWMSLGWSKLGDAGDAVYSKLTLCESYFFSTEDHQDEAETLSKKKRHKKRRREYPLVFLLASAIVVVAVTTGIEARQLWTEHAAATHSVERYLTTSLVLSIGEAMHETQRERGLASAFLGSGKKSKTALDNLERQYQRSDGALCRIFEALLRHADAVEDSSEQSSLSQPPPHEMAALVAPIFGINANRRRDSPTFHARAVIGGTNDDENNLCVNVDVSSSKKEGENDSHCSTSGCAFSADRYGVGTYDCKSARCRQVASILLFLQSSSPTGGSSRPVEPSSNAGGEDTNSGSSRAASFEYYTGLNRNLLRLATTACVELVRNLRAGPSLAASLLYAYVNLAAFKEKAGVERGVISTELAFARSANQKSLFVRHRNAMVNLHRKIYEEVTDKDLERGQPGERTQNAGDDSADEEDSTSQSRAPSLSALVRLREVVAQQDVYLSSFLAFVTPSYVEEYDRIRAESCVVHAEAMRRTLIHRLHVLEMTLSTGGFFDYSSDLLDDAAQYVLPTPARPPPGFDPKNLFKQQNDEKVDELSRKSTSSSQNQGIDSSAEDGEIEARLFSALREVSEDVTLWFSEEQWWANQTCRIDHLQRTSETLAIAIHQEAENARRVLSIRAVRLAAPLLACFVATLLVGLRAIQGYIQYRDLTEKRVKKLETRRLRYRDLLSRWAPLSSWMLDDDTHDDSSTDPSMSQGDAESSDETSDTTSSDGNMGAPSAAEPPWVRAQRLGMNPASRVQTPPIVTVNTGRR